MNLKKYEKLEEIDSYFDDIKDYRPLTKEEECELSEEIKKGNKKALDKMVTSNLRFVINIAKAYRKSGVPFSDLISEGNLGLIKAAEKFDSNKGVRFISYAVWWIKNSIQECIEEYKKGMNESSGVDDYIFDNCTDTEMEYYQSCINEDFENELMDLQSRKASINELMKCLKGREAKIVIEYFGLRNGKEKTLDELSNEMNLTNERIRQIKDKALVKLRTEALMSNEFETYKNLR